MATLQCQNSRAKHALIVLSLVLLVATAAACGGGNESGRNDEAVEALGLPDLSGQRVDVSALAPDPAGEAAPSPEAAIEQFLRAEIDGDFATSFGLLAAEERLDVPTLADWIDAHVDFPQYTGFELTEMSDGESDRAEETGGRVATGTATLVPTLDEFNGLFPASGELRVLVVPEDEGWRVAYNETILDPDYPSTDGAEAVARRWLEAASACEDTSDLEYEFGLLGVTGFGDKLCAAEGDLSLGKLTSLGDHPIPTPVVASVSAQSLDWAKYYRIESPVEFDLVLAPLGDNWIVLAALLPAQ